MSRIHGKVAKSFSEASSFASKPHMKLGPFGSTCTRKRWELQPTEFHSSYVQYTPGPSKKKKNLLHQIAYWLEPSKWSANLEGNGIIQPHQRLAQHVRCCPRLLPVAWTAIKHCCNRAIRVQKWALLIQAHCCLIRQTTIPLCKLRKRRLGMRKSTVLCMLYTLWLPTASLKNTHTHTKKMPPCSPHVCAIAGSATACKTDI